MATRRVQLRPATSMPLVGRMIHEPQADVRVHTGKPAKSEHLPSRHAPDSITGVSPEQRAVNQYAKAPPQQSAAAAGDLPTMQGGSDYGTRNRGLF